MKKLFKKIQLNKDLILIFILTFFLSISQVINSCSGYLSYSSFDLHEFLLWNYSALNNIIPYRDIFYPYGLLHFYRNVNIYLFFINYVLSPLFLTLIYYFFRKIINNKYSLFISYGAFLLFVYKFIGLEIFSRYGLFISFSLFITYAFFYKEVLSKKLNFIIGIVIGLTITLINDQGIYLILAYAFIYLIKKIYSYSESKTLISSENSKNFIAEIFFPIAGFICGIIPYAVYGYLTNINFNYFNYFTSVRDISIAAKTPFFFFINSPANIFTIGILIIEIVYLLINYFYLKKKISLSIFFQITLVFDILLIKQKSTIRSIDRQITFASFILLIFFLNDLFMLIKKDHKFVYFKLLFPLILFSIIALYSINIKDLQPVNYQNVLSNLNKIIKGTCYRENLNSFISNNPNYQKTINNLKSEPNFNGKIFSFPQGDSLFYVLLKQKPPYFNSIFEGSSVGTQEESILYIVSNDINFVILNIKTSIIYDEVPDFIRQPIVFKYLLNNYYPIKIIDKHLILKKDFNKDFFSSELLFQIEDYKNYLLSVNLNNIPYSEGKYKYELLDRTKPLLSFNSVNQLENYFKTKSISSKDKVIVFVPDEDLEQNQLTSFSLNTKEGYQTNILYNSCKNKQPCIINLSNIPLFYKEREIISIIMDKKIKGKLMIFNIENIKELW